MNRNESWKLLPFHLTKYHKKPDLTLTSFFSAPFNSDMAALRDFVSIAGITTDDCTVRRTASSSLSSYRALLSVPSYKLQIINGRLNRFKNAQMHPSRFFETS